MRFYGAFWVILSGNYRHSSNHPWPTRKSYFVIKTVLGNGWAPLYAMLSARMFEHCLGYIFRELNAWFNKWYTWQWMNGACWKSGEAAAEPWVGSQIAKFMGPTWGPPGSCRPQMGPMLAPWTLLLGLVMMKAGHGFTFCITDPLCEESTSYYTKIAFLRVHTQFIMIAYIYYFISYTLWWAHKQSSHINISHLPFDDVTIDCAIYNVTH